MDGIAARIIKPSKKIKPAKAGFKEKGTGFSGSPNSEGAVFLPQTGDLWFEEMNVWLYE